MQGGEKKFLNEKYVALIPPHTTYSTMCTQPFRHFFIHFQAPAPFDKVKRKIFYFPSIFAECCIKSLIEHNSKIYRTLTIRMLIFEYLRQIPESDFLPQSKPIMDPRIKYAIDLMEQDISHSYDNHRLSRKTGMSLNNFYKCFLRETGTSPLKYLHTLRMTCARNFLLYSKLSIDEIAVKTGFANRNHFSKAFKNLYGLPPITYKTKSQKKY